MNSARSTTFCNGTGQLNCIFCRPARGFYALTGLSKATDGEGASFIHRSGDIRIRSWIWATMKKSTGIDAFKAKHSDIYANNVQNERVLYTRVDI